MQPPCNWVAGGAGGAGSLRRAFDDKAPHQNWARQVPVSVIVHPEPALLGLSGLVSRPERFIFSSQSWQG